MIKRKFRLYPDDHFVCVEVFVHNTRKAMFDHVGIGKNPDYEGICLGFTVWDFSAKGKKTPKLNPVFSEIHLHAKYLGIGICSHELCHATHRYFELRKELGLSHGCRSRSLLGNDCTDQEEAFCWVLGNLVRQFCIQLHEEGTYETGPQGYIKPIPKSIKFPAY